jgi:hypothetical protein
LQGAAFVSERGSPLSLVARTGAAAGFGFLVHSHIFRHGYEFKLAADDPARTEPDIRAGLSSRAELQRTVGDFFTRPTPGLGRALNPSWADVAKVGTVACFRSASAKQLGVGADRQVI